MPPDPQLLTFGREIRRRRLAMGISQEKLAEEANLHRNYIGLLERGERNPKLKTVFEIARALNISAAELFESSDAH